MAESVCFLPDYTHTWLLSISKAVQLIDRMCRTLTIFTLQPLPASIRPPCSLPLIATRIDELVISSVGHICLVDPEAIGKAHFELWLFIRLSLRVFGWVVAHHKAASRDIDHHCSARVYSRCASRKRHTFAYYH